MWSAVVEPGRGVAVVVDHAAHSDKTLLLRVRSVQFASVLLIWRGAALLLL